MSSIRFSFMGCQVSKKLEQWTADEIEQVKQRVGKLECWTFRDGECMSIDIISNVIDPLEFMKNKESIWRLADEE